MGRKRKSCTVSGQRIPIELVRQAKMQVVRAYKDGKRISMQDAYRMIARRWR